jgi:hypothetical protein
MKPPIPVPKTIEELRQAIVERYDHLSKRLQLIARHALDQPDDFAPQTAYIISLKPCRALGCAVPGISSVSAIPTAPVRGQSRTRPSLQAVSIL